MKKQIPCIKNKCISYPLCINKKEIVCDLLGNYLIDLHGELPIHRKMEITKNIWVFIRRYLKRVNMIHVGDLIFFNPDIIEGLFHENL